MDEPVRQPRQYVLTLRCPDARGIVHAATGAILDVDGNVVEQAQYTDPDHGIFTLRTVLDTDTDYPEVYAALTRAVAPFGATLRLRDTTSRYRMMLAVTREPHCLVDLLTRLESGHLPIEVPLIVSNREDLAPIADRYSIPFEHLPITDGAKDTQERALLDRVAELSIDYVVLARYMQILSPRFCDALPGRIVNIHHSFLPAFVGARPYHQAYDRGVKLIGATAHFVTSVLDDGPIIEQEVIRVQHHHGPEQLAELGADLERLVLARAVGLIADDRVILDSARTIVFP